MKMVSVGIDPDHVKFLINRVSAELFDCSDTHNCKINIVNNNKCSSIDRRFFKSILISSISFFLFDLVFRTTVTLWDWEARWPIENVYCYFFSKWMLPEIGIGRVLYVEVQLWPKAKWSYFKLVSNDCHYLTSV